MIAAGEQMLEDKLRLMTLKSQGWDNESIALDLGCTTSAVIQQWRKTVDDDPSLDPG